MSNDTGGGNRLPPVGSLQDIIDVADCNWFTSRSLCRTKDLAKSMAKTQICKMILEKWMGKISYLHFAKS